MPRNANFVEETGLTAGDWTALGTIDNSNGATTDVAHIFLARNLKAWAGYSPRGQASGTPLDAIR